MTNPNDDLKTEELIKRTAKKLFFEQGKFNATTQEIADAAGVNRTLINYYFRSRDNLFNLIFEDAVRSEEKLRESVLYSEQPFRQKLEAYLDESIRQAIEYPYLKTYIVSKINEGIFYHEKKNLNHFFERFYTEFTEEVKKGNIEEMEPIQFVLNVVSLVSFPLAMRPLLQSSIQISDEEYDRIISERKKIIIKLLFKN